MSNTSAVPTLVDLMAAEQITVSAVFVPLSKSRNADKAKSGKVMDCSLNWKVTVEHKGRPIYTTDYQAGIGHCTVKLSPSMSYPSLAQSEAIRAECETGRIHRPGALPGGPIPAPDPVGVLSCLLSDADAINYATYEDWGPELGYDRDSREGERLYRACLETGLALRAGLGAELFERLMQAERD